MIAKIVNFFVYLRQISNILSLVVKNIQVT